MIFKSSQYFARKEQIKSIKNCLKNEIVKLAIFVLLCVMTASLIQNNTPEISYTFHYAQNKIVNKHTRGIFPPLEGKTSDLLGCWNIATKIGQNQFDFLNFANYSLCFQNQQLLRLIKVNYKCLQDTRVLNYQWNAFSYNLFISQEMMTVTRSYNKSKQSNESKNLSHQNNNTNSQVEVDNLQDKDSNENKKEKTGGSSNRSLQQSNSQSNVAHEDNHQQKLEQQIQSNKQQNSQVILKCFDKNEQILKYVLSFTVWTARDQFIYLLSEAIINGDLDKSIFVLRRAY